MTTTPVTLLAVVLAAGGAVLFGSRWRNSWLTKGALWIGALLGLLGVSSLVELIFPGTLKDVASWYVRGMP
jgi:type IV secretory pathway VirB2 component (pilin)